jgi:hypothetical protein
MELHVLHDESELLDPCPRPYPVEVGGVSFDDGNNDELRDLVGMPRG